MKNGDELACPVTTVEHTGFSQTGEKLYSSHTEGGMTKREVFAMAAMQGILSNDGGGPEDVADRAIAIADELLKQLEK